MTDLYAIEAGPGDWRKPWIVRSIAHNATTGAEYRGVNVISLWATAAARQYPLHAAKAA